MSVAQTEILHASAVAIGNRGLIITGPSGSGKSSLAIQLIALGAELVADDRVIAEAHSEGGLLISAPNTIVGQIEARGVGLLTLPHRQSLAIAVVDLTQTTIERLPPNTRTRVAGIELPLIPKVERPDFAPMLLLYLKTGALER